MRIQSLLINSAQRVYGSGTTTNFRWNVLPSVPNVIGTRLAMATIENGYYFTQAGTYTITIGASPYTLTIPEGYYDDAGISYLISTQLNQKNPLASPGTAQSTFFANITPSGFFQIINDQNNSWTISFDSVSASILGFVASTVYSPVGTNQPFIVQSLRYVRIPNTTYLFLQSEALGNGIYDGNGFASFKSLVSGTSPTSKGNDIIYENLIPFDTNIKTFRQIRAIDQVDICLKDIYGTPVPLNTNNNMILVVELLIDE